ncbi:DoxX family protein [Streptomyces paludis]|uniref:DoxX family protein n=1 Tax=Streptomyces paludis TaxID=2282738 RepID=A0A345HZS7_9ACTN|nr:DoxX family protein [Streptomyces paludis]AXG82201.1 DoxX family protein [Streptomyces paludis]
MYVTAIVLSALLALAAAGAGVPKLLDKGTVPGVLRDHLKVGAALVRLIGLAEVAAAVGLVGGIFWQPLGIAAAAGLAGLFAGAVIYHRRAGDYADAEARGGAMGPVVLGLVSVAVGVTLALSL